MIKSRKHILGFDDRLMMLFGIPLVSIMINAILFGPMAQAGDISTFSFCQIFAFSYTILYWFFFREIHFFFIKRYPDYKQLMQRYIRMIPAVIISFVLLKIVLGIYIDPIIHDALPQQFKPHELTEVISSILFLSLIMVIYETKYLAYQLRTLMIEKEQLLKENISSQLEGLRNQVNPHFLFNSLNTLTSIIPDDPDRAVRFVTKMSKVYRYILEIKDKKIIPVREELEFLEAYSFLLKERFGNNINISINVPKHQLDSYIVPLSLQIIFENAIKHNIISKDKPLAIEVFVEKDKKLVVRNNLQKKEVIEVSTKVGLQNIKNRYRFFTDVSVDVISTMKHFIVSLPLLESAS